MTFTEKFEQLKRAYAEQADFSKVREDIAAQITLTDDDCGGTFYVTCRKGKTEIAPYDYRDNTVSVRVRSDLLEQLLQGKKNPVKEFLAGHLDAEGEASHALALIDAMRVRRTARRTPPEAGGQPAADR